MPTDLYSQLAGQFGNHLRRTRGLRQPYHRHPIGKARADLPYEAERKSRLAGTARARQRHQRHVLIGEQPGQVLDLAIASNYSLRTR